MATKLNTNERANFATKKLWGVHQKNEQTRVNNYKEGICFFCFKNRAVSASLSELCERCTKKGGTEAILAVLPPKFYAMCHMCGEYKFKINVLNIRGCETCNYRIRQSFKNLRKKGVYGSDPFFKSLRRKNGKDWKLLFSNGAKTSMI